MVGGRIIHAYQLLARKQDVLGCAAPNNKTLVAHCIEGVIGPGCWQGAVGLDLLHCQPVPTKLPGLNWFVKVNVLAFGLINNMLRVVQRSFR